MLHNWFKMQRDKRLQEEEKVEIENIKTAFDVSIKHNDMYIFCDRRAVELLDKTLTIEEVLDKVFQMKCAGISLIKYKNNEENT